MPAKRSTPPGASRRRFLAVAAGAAGVLATGCRPLFRAKTEPAPPDPDVTATVRSLDLVDELLAGYAAAGRAHSGLAGDLRPFSKRHEAHSAALRERLPAGHAAKRSPTPAASPEDRSLADLLDAEKGAARSLAASALDASPTLAQVLASVSACCAAHVRLLPEVKR